jgi:3-hydroxyisobutyrate dehydrogenase
VTKVAFIGLGVMGYPMAGHLSRKGFEVSVFNRTKSKSVQWVVEHSNRLADTPREAAKDAEFVFCCVGNDDDVRSVVLGPDGALSGMDQGAILVDHTTASADLARELEAECAKRGVGFLDAPVSGGQAGAEHGTLSIMVGGAETTYVAAEPVMASYGKKIKRIGDSGSGQLCKMVNQICIAGLVQGLSEGILFAEQAGLDVAEVIDVISKGAAGSWQMENRAETMTAREFNHGFAVDWMRKDLGLCLDVASDLGVDLPITSLVDQFYADVQAMGGGRWDTSSLIARLSSS